MTDYNHNQQGNPNYDVNGNPTFHPMTSGGGAGSGSAQPQVGPVNQAPPFSPAPPLSPIPSKKATLTLVLGLVALVLAIAGLFVSFRILKLFPLFLVLEILALGAGIAAIVLYVMTKKKASQQAFGHPVKSGPLTGGFVCGIIAVVFAVIFSISCSCTYAVARQALDSLGGRSPQEVLDELEKWGDHSRDGLEDFSEKFGEEFAQEFNDSFEK